MKLNNIFSVFFLLFCVLVFQVQAAEEWQEGTSYHAGDIVTYQGKNYEAIQAHTAHIGVNWTPSTSPTLWREVTGNSPTISEETDDCGEGGAIKDADSCTQPEGEKLLTVNFNHLPKGFYQAADFREQWGISPGNASGLSAGRLNIVTDPLNPNNNVLQVTYKAGLIGGNSAMVFNAPLKNEHKSLWLQYRVMFSPDFTWVKGGKLPGLAGGDRPTGCIDNGTFDGFSTRLMWRENGAVYGYLYYPDKKGRCGDYFSTDVHFTQGKWYTLTQHVILNDVSKSNGTFVQYINGNKILELDNIVLRNGSDVDISTIKMDTFFGGSTSDWAPEKDQHAYFDDFIVSTANLR